MSLWNKAWATGQRPSKTVIREVKYSKTGWKPILITIGVVLAILCGLAVLAVITAGVCAFFFLKAVKSLAPRVNKDAMWLYTPRINKDAMSLYVPRVRGKL